MYAYEVSRRMYMFPLVLRTMMFLLPCIASIASCSVPSIVIQFGWEEGCVSETPCVLNG